MPQKYQQESPWFYEMVIEQLTVCVCVFAGSKCKAINYYLYHINIGLSCLFREKGFIEKKTQP